MTDQDGQPGGNEEATSVIEVRGLHKSFGQLEVLRGVSLSVNAGDVVVVIGPSGSGKTTLLRCINYLEDFDAGEILIEGQPIGYRQRQARREALPARHNAALRTEVGMVFQAFNLFPHKTALENVALAPRLVRRLSKGDADARATQMLEKVGLSDKLQSYPSKLSGGQQQRVAIARALAMQPKSMLFDEVTSALDPELVGEVLGVIRGLARDGMTMLIVTHEMLFARDVADRIVFMDAGQIVEEGAPREMLFAPKTDRLKQFLHRFTYDPALETSGPELP